jgi:hypothetical protein
VRRAPGGYSFDLPANAALPEEQMAVVRVRYPVKKGWLFKKVAYDAAEARVYVERTEPFTCNVRVFQPNPERTATLSGSQLKFWAATQGGANRRSVSETIAAKDLFLQSVPQPDHALFDLSSIALVNVTTSEAHSDICEHAQSWHTSGWNTASFHYTIEAPDIGVHLHSGSKEECWQIGPYKAKFAQRPKM